ncbi:hypothetical protein XELAEV_18034323mg [Xenopus laevis]|uniref:Alpha-macroglobulin receptor-binding domain-containing protein n=1 Tax=Xenopus laevis TaxID=8355 RepID=A0A974HAZ5_XENLA|nr:hypothetical protein XELAEV_18034323mg [Xenopus laevis]
MEQTKLHSSFSHPTSTVRYNAPVLEGNSTFSISITSPSSSCVNGFAYSFSINLSYHGNKNQSNQVIVDIKLLSGYTVDYQSLAKLHDDVLKAEQINNHLIVYIEPVSRDPVSMSVTLDISERVQDLQPQYVHVYDYYDRGNLNILQCNCHDVTPIYYCSPLF